MELLVAGLGLVARGLITRLWRTLVPHHSEARGVGDFSDLQPPKGGDGDRLVRLPGNNPDASTRRLSRVPSLTRRPQPFSLSHSHSCLPRDPSAAGSWRH